MSAAFDEAPALPCACARWGFDDSVCACPPEERWARHLSDHTPGTPPLDDAARARWSGRVASVEGYPKAEELAKRPDHELARLWMESMADYCRDKGLLP